MGTPIIQSWCPTVNPCGICACHWVPQTDSFTLPTIVDPGHPDDGAIDQIASFCGSPVWGLGLIATSTVDPGELVPGYIDISVDGTWAVLGLTLAPLTAAPESPLPIPVTFGGVIVFSFDPATGVQTAFTGGTASENFGPPSYTTYVYGASYRITVPDCIMLDPAKDRFTAPFNCVLPYAGPIPDPEFTITVSIPATVNSVPVFFIANAPDVYTGQETIVTPPPVYLHVKKTIDPV